MKKLVNKLTYIDSRVLNHKEARELEKRGFVLQFLSLVCLAGHYYDKFNIFVRG